MFSDVSKRGQLFQLLQISDTEKLLLLCLKTTLSLLTSLYLFLLIKPWPLLSVFIEKKVIQIVYKLLIISSCCALQGYVDLHWKSYAKMPYCILYLFFFVCFLHYMAVSGNITVTMSV